MKITTPYGEWYEIDDNGNVIRCSNGLDKSNASEAEKATWRILGATSTHPFARVHIVPLTDLVNTPLLYKNRNPRWTIVDNDNGTIRVHGNTKVHGIHTITR